MPSAAQAATLGIPLSAYAAQPPVDVWPENVQAVALFQNLGTQWLPAPMGGYLGLNYAVLPTVLAWSGITVAPDDMPDLFQALRWLEKEALGLLNKRDED